MSVQIQWLRNTKAVLDATTLPAGAIVVDSTDWLLRVGDGVTLGGHKTLSGTQLGAPGGVASLDANGKLPLSQLTGGAMDLQGVWNAASNMPALTSGQGTDGYTYIVVAGGTTNLDGIATWNAGDQALFFGGAWHRIETTNAVTSVAGRTGNISLSAADIEGLGSMAGQAANNVNIAGGIAALSALTVENDQDNSTTLTVTNSNTGSSGANQAAFSAFNGVQVGQFGVFGQNRPAVGPIQPGYGFTIASTGLCLAVGNGPILAGSFNTEFWRTTQSGNFLLGTTTDNGSKLQVSGSIAAEGANSALNIADRTSTSGLFWSLYSQEDILRFWHDGTDRYSFDGSGNFYVAGDITARGKVALNDFVSPPYAVALGSRLDISTAYNANDMLGAGVLGYFQNAYNAVGNAGMLALSAFNAQAAIGVFCEATEVGALVFGISNAANTVTEGMRLTPSGLQIGGPLRVGSPAYPWVSGSWPLDFGAQTALWDYAYSGGNASFIVNNGYYDGQTWRAKVAAPSTAVALTNGGLQVFTAQAAHIGAAQTQGLIMAVGADGNIQFPKLAGSGNRPVYADPNGHLIIGP